MTRAIQAVPRSRLSSEMEHRWGGKNVKIVYPRAESGGGGAHWLLRPHDGIICIYGLGRGRGRLGVILARRHPPFHSAEPTAPSSSSTPSSHHTALPQSSRHRQGPGSSRGAGKLPLSAGIGRWGKPRVAQQRAAWEKSWKA